MAEKVTLAMIAKACNLSVGTVSRALNDRSDISEETKEQVARVARELGYKGTGGASCVPLRIGIVYCREQADFYREVTAGIQAAQAELGERRVRLDLLQTEQLDQPSQAELLGGLDPTDYDGLLINSAGIETEAYINRFMEQGIPVATFNTDAPSSRRLFFVGCNAHVCGQMGAHLLGKLVNGQGKIILSGSILGQAVWADRFSSAYAVLQQDFPEIEVVPVFEDVPSQEEMAKRMQEFLRSYPDITGIFPINNARTCETISLLRAYQRPDIHVVGFDLTRETKDGVRDGLCDALLFQNPYRQGYYSVMGMVKYLTSGALPSAAETNLIPRIIMKYNLDTC